MMQRFWRAWDIHRGVTILAIAALAVALMSTIGVVEPSLADAVPNPLAAHDSNGRFDDIPAPDGTWDPCHQPIEYRTDAVGADRDLIDRAFDRLTDVTGITFVAGPPLTGLPATSDGGILVGFTGGDHPTFDDHKNAAGIARTTIRNGHITGAVVAVRTDRQLLAGFGPGATQGNVLLHELGHAMGLPHTNDPTSLMYPQANSRQGDGYAPQDIRALQAATRMPAACP